VPLLRDAVRGEATRELQEGSWRPDAWPAISIMTAMASVWWSAGCLPPTESARHSAGVSPTCVQAPETRSSADAYRRSQRVSWAARAMYIHTCKPATARSGVPRFRWLGAMPCSATKASHGGYSPTNH
jgi:hypothetical protein